MCKLMQGLDTISVAVVLCPRHYSLTTTVPSLQLPGGRLGPGGGRPLLPGKLRQHKRTKAQAVQRRCRLDTRKNFFMERVIKDWTAQGAGWVTITRGVQEMSGHGTQCCGLVDIVVISQRLDTILQVFFSLNDSEILFAHVKRQSQKTQACGENYQCQVPNMAGHQLENQK